MAEARWTTQEIGADRVLVKVNVDANGIEEELKKHLENTRRTTHVDGFRKGKTPDHVLMKKFGQKLLADTQAGLLESSVKAVSAKILQQRKAKEPGEPRTESVSFVRGTGLSFDLWLKVPPRKTGETHVAGLEHPLSDGTVVDLRRT